MILFFHFSTIFNLSLFILSRVKEDNFHLYEEIFIKFFIKALDQN